jgi:hypothetical protein
MSVKFLLPLGVCVHLEIPGSEELLERLADLRVA